MVGIIVSTLEIEPYTEDSCLILSARAVVLEVSSRLGGVLSSLEGVSGRRVDEVMIGRGP